MANDSSHRLSFSWIWLVGPGCFMALYCVLGLFDTKTEITPQHDAVLNFCFALGGLGALCLASASLFGVQNANVWQRVYFAAALAILGFLSVFLLSSRIAELTENYLDFPRASTRTFSGFLLINRAYRTQGKGQSWNIQTMPIWSNLDITPDDYQFMLDHRPPGDRRHNDDEISSKGYFCAHVLMQQSGSALRILNSGSNKLPAGSVAICPPIRPSPTR